MWKKPKKKQQLIISMNRQVDRKILHVISALHNSTTAQAQHSVSVCFVSIPFPTAGIAPIYLRWVSFFIFLVHSSKQEDQ